MLAIVQILRTLPKSRSRENPRILRWY